MVNLNISHINFAGWELWCAVDKLCKSTDGNTVVYFEELKQNYIHVLLMICVLLSVIIIMWSHAHLYQLQVNFSKQYTVAISFIYQVNPRFMAVSHACFINLSRVIHLMLYVHDQARTSRMKSSWCMPFLRVPSILINYILGQWISWISIILPNIYFYVYVYTRPKQ